MGFLGLACVFTVVVAVVNLLFVLTPFGKPREPGKTLRITIPEDLEYDGVFDEVLNRYAAESELTEVTTTKHGQPLPADLPAPPGASGGLRKR